jgi:hypothetical protein
MTSGLTVTRQFRLQRQQRGRQRLRPAHPNDNVSFGRVPRIARLMALAIRFDQLLRDGIVADQAELARLGHVSRARLTQIMNLLNLAPDIQEELLYFSLADTGRDSISERQLRPLAAEPDWRRQRQRWGSANRSN